MNRNRLLSAATLMAAGLIASQASQAAPVYMQNAPVVSGNFSDKNATLGLTTADDFSIAAAATITSVVWRGIYSVGNTPQAAAADDFVITFYSYDAFAQGSVGTTLQSFDVGSVSRSGTGTTVNSTYPVFEYQADLGGSGFAAAPGHYWISIRNDTSSDADDDWYWGVFLNGGNGWNARGDVGQRWTEQTTMGGTYFTLNDSPVVPLPAAAWLLFSGIGAVGAFARRRRASA